MFKKDKRNSIYDMYPLANIGDGYIEYINGYKTYMYKIDSYMDNDWNNDFQLESYINNIVKSLADIDDSYLINISIIGRKNSKLIDQKIDMKMNELDNEFLKSYLNHKKEIIFEQKVLTIVIGISHLNNKFKSDDFNFIEKIQMKDMEIFNFLYNIFNLDKYNDLLDREPDCIKGLMTPLVSLNSLLLDSYIQEQERSLIVGDTFVDQFIVSTPPPINEKYIQIGDIINHLSNNKSDFIVTVMLKNNKNILSGFSKLGRKKSMGAGALLSYTSSLNNEIVDNVNKFQKYIIKNNYTPVEVSIFFSIFNNKEEELKLDSNRTYKIKGFESAAIIKNTYSKLPDYLGHIPGYYTKFRYNFVMSSKEMATLLLLPKVKYDSLNLFTKSSNLLTSFKFHDPSVGLPGGLIFAPPGRGKSALLNYMFLNYLIEEPDMKGLIIDYGGSYRALFDIIKKPNMTYTSFDLTEGNYYNIFDLEFGEEITEEIIKLKVNVLINFFIEALHIDDIEEGILIEGLTDMFNKICFEPKFMKKDRELGVDGISYLNQYKNDKTDIEAFLAGMPNIGDFTTFVSQNQNIRNNYEAELRKLSEKLRNFLNTRGKIFSKNSTQYFLNDILIVDLKHIAQTDEKMLNIVLVYLMQSKLLTFSLKQNLNVRKLLLIDEYNQFRKRSDFINKITNTVFETGRKEKIDQFLISQNVSDFDSKMFNNCSFFIGFNPSVNEEIIRLKEITAYPMEELEMMNTHIKTVPNKYSEFIVFTNNSNKERTKLRFAASRYEYYSFITTSKVDIDKRNELIEKYGDIDLAIKEMIAYEEKDIVNEN